LQVEGRKKEGGDDVLDKRDREKQVKTGKQVVMKEEMMLVLVSTRKRMALLSSGSKLLVPFILLPSPRLRTTKAPTTSNNLTK
jgi:hypothetical protein